LAIPKSLVNPLFFIYLLGKLATLLHIGVFYRQDRQPVATHLPLAWTKSSTQVSASIDRSSVLAACHVPVPLTWSKSSIDRSSVLAACHVPLTWSESSPQVSASIDRSSVLAACHIPLTWSESSPQVSVSIDRSSVLAACHVPLIWTIL
jgi:hypothetical protein